MSDNKNATHNKIETDRQGLSSDEMYSMTQSEIRMTSGGGSSSGSLLYAWETLCIENPNSAPCKGRH